MSFKIGIVGLPNVGKSTLFRAITKKQVEAQNYPFCTIDPNVGVVAVPDSRLEKISAISSSKKTVPTAVEFVDIAGLVKGAHEGKGLGNKFLSHIREVDAIVEVLRGFDDKDILHVEGSIDSLRDKQIIDTELIVSDIQLIEKVLPKIEKLARSGDKEALTKVTALEKTKSFLEEEKKIIDLTYTEKEKEAVKEFNFLTSKPIIYLKNIKLSEMTEQKPDSSDSILIDAKIEAELSELSKEEVSEYLQTFNIKQSGLNKLIKRSYEALNLISFFTSGEEESRAWTVRRGAFAPEAAGKVHSDFEKKFIRAEVVSSDDFINLGGWSKAREKGAIKDKGKDYEVQDGDIMIFKVGT